MFDWLQWWNVSETQVGAPPTATPRYRQRHTHEQRQGGVLATTGFDDKVSFIWSVADELRGDFKAHEYGQVILPFLVLRRLECALEPTKAEVIAQAASLAGKVDNVEPMLQMTSGRKFYNTSPLDLTTLLNDPGNVAANLRTYIAGFSPGAVEVLERYGFDDKITRLDQAGLLYRIVAKFADLDLSEDRRHQRRDGLHLRGTAAPLLGDEQRNRG